MEDLGSTDDARDCQREHRPGRQQRGEHDWRDLPTGGGQDTLGDRGGIRVGASVLVGADEQNAVAYDDAEDREDAEHRWQRSDAIDEQGCDRSSTDTERDRHEQQAGQPPAAERRLQ